jgi:hypothetical protein
MKRQVCLGCVGSTDCAITRHCSLASSSARLGGLSRRGHALVILLPVHHRPGDARRLVRQRYRHDQAWPPSAQPDHPWIGIRRLRAQQVGAGAVDQQPSQIAVAALRYPAETGFAAGRVTGGVDPRVDGEGCTGDDKGAVEAAGLFTGMAIQSDGLSVVSPV